VLRDYEIHGKGYVYGSHSRQHGPMCKAGMRIPSLQDQKGREIKKHIIGQD
jgi:hypothetical protein